MENASQALLIAGGILITILILSMVVVMISNISTAQQTIQTQEEIERLSSWNAEWEAYNKKLLYGTEVLTIMNKAEQNNIEFENSKQFIIEIKIYDENNKLKCEIKEDGTIDNKEYLQKNKNNVFECTNMTKSTETGRVKWIEFKVKE